VIWLGIQNTLVYRINFLCRAIFNLLPLIAIIALWRTIYSDRQESISGYSITQMVSYYLLVCVIDALTSVTEDDWQIAADIKEGHISQFLVRPINYLGYRLCFFCSGRFVFTLSAVGPILVFLLAQHDYFVWPDNGWLLAGFTLSLLLSALMQFFISYALAMLAFWVLEISSFVFVLLACQRLLGGQLFPLDILPSGWERILLYTPFPYQSYFPASLYLGRMAPDTVMVGLFIQGGWVVLAWFVARLGWHSGLRNYTAVGG
jgi:ABC-2 type transport system permease protein